MILEVGDQVTKCDKGEADLSETFGPWKFLQAKGCHHKDTPTCLHTMYAENQTKWLSEYLQAELTIVSTSQTKHLIPCFQYEFDIQQYSTTPGGQC